MWTLVITLFVMSGPATYQEVHRQIPGLTYTECTTQRTVAIDKALRDGEGIVAVCRPLRG